MRRAFSFVEVLFVVASAGLLAAFFVPILASGKREAKVSTCMENMQQMGRAIMLYTQDHDEVLPVTTELRPKLNLGRHWTFVIQPYLRNANTFVCPQDKEPLETYDLRPTQQKAVPRLSYINNYAAIPAHDFYPVPKNVLTDPGSLILIAERRAMTASGVRFRAWKGASAFWPGQPCRELNFGEGYRRVQPTEAERMLTQALTDKDLLITRVNWTAHDNRSNYVFADGHAQALTLSRTLEPTAFLWGERFYPRSEDGAECDPLTSTTGYNQL